MRKNKTWLIDLFNTDSVMRKQPVTQIQNDEFWTSDTEAYLNFKVSTQEFIIDTAKINLYNKYDGTLVQRDMTKQNNEAQYELPQEIIAHFGNWNAQVVFISGTERYTSPMVDFEVKRTLGDDLPEKLGLIQDWKDLNDEAKAFVAEIDVVLNQFDVDSQAKLNQYDADVQQAIADIEQGAGVGIPQTISKSGDIVTLSNMGGSISLADYAKASQVLTNVPSDAEFTDTVYTHPSSHPASMITETSTKRFVADSEKAAWNSKQNALTAGSNITISGNTIDVDLTEVQAMIDTQIGDIEDALAQVIGGV